jgi:penicillin-binding protein-related factor A (putative recombinase)
MIKESDIQRSILEYLSCNHDGFFWKVNNGGVYDPVRGHFRKHNSRFTPKGISDIIGIYKGKLIAIEVKSAKGTATKEQKEFLKNIAEQGGVAFIARSVEDVRRELNICEQYH